ncbi:ABC transporter ATP-binding protein [Patulibacter medicamentivorans]|uniref:ABC transporter ATP-binding protein n=1 Tax=Patulibacter medicamentivorans TaxID=1097667 RepID=H0EAL0_9ACTN|nr:ABC transporter ATP-binding protein [Patulibacter medicamentivorans]EHN09337.1 ABC transporter ATP-binding protein [Patulibacter medicamentivorans]
MSEPRPVLQTHGLRKRYGDREVVRGVDLQVPRGVAFGFLGPNGAGKTTVIRMLLGLTAADAGTMQLLGHDLPGDRREALRRVGAIVEEPRFHARMSGRENLWIHAAVLDRAAEQRIPAALERVGLADRADDRVGGYSLGMRQRLGIARCLLCDPELLILDEPANGLDPAGIRELRALVRSLVAEGRTVFLSSHLLDEVEKTCDMAAVIRDGRIVAQGSLDELAASREPRIELKLARAGEAATLLAARPDVQGTSAGADDRLTVRLRVTTISGEHQITGELVRHLVAHGFAPYGVSSSTERLEDRVLELLSRSDDEAVDRTTEAPTLVEA